MRGLHILSMQPHATRPHPNDYVMVLAEISLLPDVPKARFIGEESAGCRPVQQQLLARPSRTSE